MGSDVLLKQKAILVLFHLLEDDADSSNIIQRHLI